MGPEAWLPFFEWVETTAVGTALAQSIWSFAVIEAIHLLGLCLLGGALLIVDLRLLGLGLNAQPIAKLTSQAHRWVVAGVILMVTTGSLLMISEPIKLYYNSSFWVKVSVLPFAVLFTFLARRRIVAAGVVETTWATRLVGAVSIGLWFVVAAAGRWIGFS